MSIVRKSNLVASAPLVFEEGLCRLPPVAIIDIFCLIHLDSGGLIVETVNMYITLCILGIVDFSW